MNVSNVCVYMSGCATVCMNEKNALVCVYAMWLECLCPVGLAVLENMLYVLKLYDAAVMRGRRAMLS